MGCSKLSRIKYSNHLYADEYQAVALYWVELKTSILMQSTKQSLTKSAETAKHKKKIERKSKTEQLVQVFKQKSLLIK